MGLWVTKWNMVVLLGLLEVEDSKWAQKREMGKYQVLCILKSVMFHVLLRSSTSIISFYDLWIIVNYEMNKWNKWKFSVRELSSNTINNSIHFNSEECTNLCKSKTAKNCVGIYKLENFFFLNKKCDFLYSFFF